MLRSESTRIESTGSAEVSAEIRAKLALTCLWPKRDDYAGQLWKLAEREETILLGMVLFHIDILKHLNIGTTKIRRKKMS